MQHLDKQRMNNVSYAPLINIYWQFKGHPERVSLWWFVAVRSSLRICKIQENVGNISCNDLNINMSCSLSY
jgi:hypothetical protein